ncbi:MAG: hypothetical protein ACJ74J_10295 [Blastocatellia bacterium]
MVWVVRTLIIILAIGMVGVPGTSRERRLESASEVILSKLAEARALLSTERVALEKGVVGTRRVRVSRRRYQDVSVIGITGREVALALLDGEGRFHLVRGLKRDNKGFNKGFETLTPGYVLTLRRENGINSEFECAAPAGARVLAIKYPVSNEGRRFGGDAEVIEAVYTPYSAEIETAAVVEQGLKVQDEFIDKAYERLKKRGVQSRAFEGRRITDVVPRGVLRVLLINEHIDPGEFRTQGLAGPLARRVLTVVATNKEKAYAYSISRAGARGLVQMIASTYSLLLRKYPEAGLVGDFAVGMADPINAVMAQVLLCDADWQSLQSRFDISPEQVGPYLAAAYNGGVGRVISLLNNEQEEWMANPDLSRRPVVTVRRRVAVRSSSRRGRVRRKFVVKTYVVPIFRSETSKYVSQYHWIKDYLEQGAQPVK